MPKVSDLPPASVSPDDLVYVVDMTQPPGQRSRQAPLSSIRDVLGRPQLAPDTVLGRVSPGNGPAEDVPCTAAGRALLDDADAAAQRTTLGLGTAATQPSSAFDAAGTAATAVAAHEAASDPHPQYLTAAEGAAAYDAIGAATAAIVAHEAASDPHPQYLTAAEGAAAYAPIGAQYVVSSADGALTAERVLTNTATVTWDAGTAGQMKANLADGSVTNAKLASVATATFKGRATAGSGAPEDLTATQATALLNVFNSTTKGLAPASGGGAVNFLRADGTWAPPVTDGDKGDITVSGGGTTWTIDAAAVTFAKMQNVAQDTLVGRVSSGSGSPEALTKAQVGTMLANSAFTMLGINATADATNRLAVSSAVTLFNNAGAGHQIKVNKAAAGDTASFLFQTGFSGRAEFGTTGDDDFHFKVSPDGINWKDALIINSTTGYVGIGNTPTYAVDIKTPSTIAFCAVSTLAPSSVSGSGIFGYVEGTPTAAGQRLGFYGLGSKGGGTQDYNTIAMAGFSEGAWTAGTSHPSYVQIETTPSGSTARTARLVVEAGGHTRPAADNAYSCGTSGNRWSGIWAAIGTIQTCDEREKEEQGKLDGFAYQMVKEIQPVLFKWKVGQNEVRPVLGEDGQPVLDADGNQKTEVVPRPGRRVHAGFYAQDVKAAMDRAGVDFGAWTLDDPNDPNSRQGTRPDQLMAVLWETVRQLQAKVEALEAAQGGTA